MSQTVITTAFEHLKAQQAATGNAVVLDGFIFAHIPGLDTASPINPAETIPPDTQIVHRADVSMTGVINENAVVYSITLGATIGNFDFNWIGLVHKASNTLAMIVHSPLQHKAANAAGVQGNVLTRSFLMEYNGARKETQITTPASTWQIDFTARLSGIDERQRLENIDIYGGAAFFDNGWLVGKNGNQFFVTKGTGYVKGLRAELASNQNITVTTKPTKVWLDVCWMGTLTSVWAVQGKVTVADSLADYEQNGVKHYVFALASIDAAGNITDLRPKGTLGDQLANKEFLRKDANLSDIDNNVEARRNLGMKEAALREVADHADGALIPVGYKGNFKSECNHGAIDFATYPFVVGESLFIDVTTCANIPPFLRHDFYYINVVCATSPAQGGRVSRPLIQFFEYTNSSIILSIREDDGTTIGWRYLRAVQFDADNINITLPGWLKVLDGAIQLSQNAISIRGSGNKHLWFHNLNNEEMGLVYASDDKSLHLRAAQGPALDIHASGDITANGSAIIHGNLTTVGADISSGRNIASAGLIQAGAGVYDTPGVRVYSPNNPPPVDFSPYATMAWVRSGFVQDVRLLGRVWVSHDGAIDAPPGCVFVSGGDFGSDNGGYSYAALQKMVNGTWYTVAHN